MHFCALYLLETRLGKKGTIKPKTKQDYGEGEKGDPMSFETDAEEEKRGTLCIILQNSRAEEKKVGLIVSTLARCSSLAFFLALHTERPKFN